MTQISPHFSLEEFTNSQTAARRGMPNEAPPHVRKNIYRTAETLEKIREILGHPILISSGYRSEWLNSAIGGSKGSAHVQGLAADFTCPGFGVPLAICQKIEPHMIELQIDQLIHEFATWVHLGLSVSDPRHMTLTIDKRGTRHGFEARS